MIPEELKSEEQVGSGVKHVFWFPLSSIKHRVDSLYSHHKAVRPITQKQLQAKISSLLYDHRPFGIPILRFFN